MLATEDSNRAVRPASRWWRETRIRERAQPVAAPVKIGLALGGGFARGIAHIGVLRAFERHGIPIHAVAGVSSGSIVAAAFAGGCTSHDIEKVALSMRFGDVARWTINRLGLAGSDRMISFLARLLKENRFEQMKMPCAIVATDLATGEPVTFQGQGDAVLAIRASCSYPGLFVPVHYENRCLVDGFISMEIPALPLRELGATHVVSVFLPTPAACSEPGNLLAVINRCFQVMSARSAHEWRRHSDLVIEPDVAGLSWDSFASAQKLIELGEKAAEAAIPAIQAWVGTASELALAV